MASIAITQQRGDMTSRRSIKDEALEVAQSKGVTTPKLQSTKCNRDNDNYIDDDDSVDSSNNEGEGGGGGAQCNKQTKDKKDEEEEDLDNNLMT